MAEQGPPQDDPPRRLSVRRGSRLGDEVQSPTLPLPPPKSREELDDVLAAIAGTPSDRRDSVIEWIAGLADRATVAELLHRELLDLPTADASRTGLILSVIGELAHPSSAEALERFAWLDDSEVLRGQEHPDDDRGYPDRSSVFAEGMLQSRAAEMLVWVSGARIPSSATRILAEHPNAAVRLATLDAVAFSADDDPAILERLRELAREEDRALVGMPRRTSRDGREGAAERIAEFQERSETEPGAPQRDSKEI